MHSPILRTRTHSDARLLDRRMHTSPRTLRFIRFPDVHTPTAVAFMGCTLCGARPSGFDRTASHPCTVTAAHHLHTRPPDARLEYQGSLVNTYSALDLRRTPHKCRSLDHCSAFVVTRSGAGIDLPAPPRTMSNDEAPAARGPPAGARAHCASARENSRTCRPGDFPPLTEFSKHCKIP